MTNKKNDSLLAAAARAQLPARSEALIVRLLEEPELPAIVRRLEAPALTRLIGKIGLEDAGEWLVLATPRQLEQVLDADVWFAERPGEPERFQARRFALWLEVLTQAGLDRAVSQLQAMDETFLAMAFSKLTRVFDVDRLQAYFAALDDDESEHEAFEKALEGLPQEEFEEYLVVARDEDGWDALVDLLTALHERDFAWFNRLMRRCVRATAAAAEDEGSYATLLNADEELIEAAAAEREARREREGYVAPQDAKAFLALVRRARRESVLREARLDPVVESYLQSLQVTPQAPPRNAQPPASERAALLAARLTAALAAEARTTDAPAERALPEAAAAGGAPSRLRSLMAELRADAPERYFACKRELGFLANALVAGDASAGRKRTPAEAAQAVLDACERGLAAMLAHDPLWRTSAERFPMVKLFRLGAAQG